MTDTAPAFELTDAQTFHAVAALLTAPGASFEIATIHVGGLETEGVRLCAETLCEVFERGRVDGNDRFTVYEDETHLFAASMASVDALGAALVGGTRVGLRARGLPANGARRR